jgi:exonuclease VII small subunit
MAADDLEKALELYRRGANMAAAAEVSGLLESLKE